MNIKIKQCQDTKFYHVAYYDSSIRSYISLDDKYFKKYKDAKLHFYAILRRLQETEE